jgi:hypothetical protein
MKTQTKWFQMLEVAVMVLVALALVACGDSEAFMANADGEMPERPTSGRQLPADSKADGPIDYTGRADDSTDELGEDSGDDMSEIPVTATTIAFDGEGMDADILFESGAQVVDVFGEGAVTTSHTTAHAGVQLVWDGRPTDVFVRTAGQYPGEWELLVMDPTSGATHRGNAWFSTGHTSFQIYVADPAAIDFLIIEPIPAR